MRNDHNKERDLLRDNQRGLLAKLEENYRTHISELEKKGQQKNKISSIDYLRLMFLFDAFVNQRKT